MKKINLHRLGRLQFQILKILWAHREATVADVHGALPNGAALAYTTVATMLRQMEGRGLVQHHRAGRTFVYQAVIAEAAVTRSMTDDLVDRVFEGSLADLVSHLLSTREVNRAELIRLEKLIAEQRRKL